jgi:hypothetical protein
MRHRLYLRIDGRPVLFIYRVQALPDPARTLGRWRDLWRAEGLPEVTIVKFDTWGNTDAPSEFGADAAAQFLPHGLADKVPKIPMPGAHPGDAIWNYDDVVRTQLSASPPAWTRHECVFPSWDNSPRRGRGRSADPERYERWLSAVHGRTAASGMVLINAWNEWAEGAYLEPDLRHGNGYLLATARALGVTPPAPGVDDPPAPDAGAAIGDRFAALYLEARENETRLRRRLSRLEGTFQRQLDEATATARAEAEEMRAHARRFAQEIDRLRAELARLQARVAAGP